MRHTLLSTSMMVTLVGASAAAYFEYFEAHPVPKVTTMALTSGDIIEVVKATGTLAPRRSVDVGSEVSGTVTRLFVDFNSIVTKGQLLATLDPAAYRDQLDAARAGAEVAQIAMDEQHTLTSLDRRNLERTEALFEDQIAVQQDLDSAIAAVKEDEAQEVADQSALASAESAVTQAELNLSHCTIASPIDGVVISRNVDEGQTVSARMTAPSLYLLGADLRHLQLTADVDESRMSRLRPRQPVTFTVEAYPAMHFDGQVTEVRLNSTTINSVVTFQVLISADNPDLRLLPGMTANLTIETGRTGETVRVPNRALAFQPTPGMLRAFGGSLNTAGDFKTSAAPTPNVSASIVAWGLKPPSNNAVPRRDLAAAARKPGATIDEFFEPLPTTTRAAQLWTIAGGRLAPVTVELGLTDGTWMQVLSGELRPGMEIVSSILMPPSAKKRMP